MFFGAEVLSAIRAMPESKHSFSVDGFPYGFPYGEVLTTSPAQA